MIMGQCIRQKFKGDKPAEFCVLGLVDDTHAAAAHLFENAVVRDDLTDHEGARSWRAIMVGALTSQVKQLTAIHADATDWKCNRIPDAGTAGPVGHQSG
jgi:hypothetical protein